MQRGGESPSDDSRQARRASASRSVPGAKGLGERERPHGSLDHRELSRARPPVDLVALPVLCRLAEHRHELVGHRLGLTLRRPGVVVAGGCRFERERGLADSLIEERADPDVGVLDREVPDRALRAHRLTRVVVQDVGFVVDPEVIVLVSHDEHMRPSGLGVRELGVVGELVRLVELPPDVLAIVTVVAVLRGHLVAHVLVVGSGLDGRGRLGVASAREREDHGQDQRRRGSHGAL